MNDILTERILPEQRVDIVAFRRKLSEERSFSPERLKQFETSVSQLFMSGNRPDKVLLVEALTDGEKYFIDVERHGGIDSSSRIFLNAAAFVNRREEKYRTDFNQAVDKLTEHALVGVLNIMDTRIKPYPAYSRMYKSTGVKQADLSEVINGKTYVFQGYSSLNRMLEGNVKKELSNVSRVSQALKSS